MLLQELEKWVSKVENEPKIDVEFPSTNKELQETEKVFHEIEVMEEGEETERTFPEYTLIANDKQCDLETKSEHKIIQNKPAHSLDLSPFLKDINPCTIAQTPSKNPW